MVPVACTALLVMACSDERPPPLSGASGSSTPTSASGSGASGSGTSGGGGRTPTSGSGGAPPLMDVSVVSDNLVIDCSAVAAADPLMGGFVVRYDNMLGSTPGSATIHSVDLLLDGGNNTLTWSFDANPETISDVPIGEISTVTHNKVEASGSGSGIGELCDYCLKGQTLTVHLTVNGQAVSRRSDPQGSFCQY